MKTPTLLGLALLSAMPLAGRAQTAPAIPTMPAPPAAAPMPAAPPVTLRFKFTLGQTSYYTLIVDTAGTMTNPLTQAPMDLKNHIQALLRQTVMDVRAADGAATVETGVDSLVFTLNGQAFPMPPDRVAAMKTLGTTLILPTGKVLSFTPNPALGGSAVPGMDFGHTNALNILGILPDAPLKVGDSWKSDIAAGVTGSQVASDFALAGVDTVGGKTIAVVHQTTDGSLGPAASPGGAAGPGIGERFEGTGTLRFDVDTGALESSTNTADMTLAMTPPGATAAITLGMKVTTNMKRTDAPKPAGAAKVQ